MKIMEDATFTVGQKVACHHPERHKAPHRNKCGAFLIPSGKVKHFRKRIASSTTAM